MLSVPVETINEALDDLNLIPSSLTSAVIERGGYLFTFETNIDGTRFLAEVESR